MKKKMKKITTKKGYKEVTGCSECPLKSTRFIDYDSTVMHCNLSDKQIGWKSNGYPDWCELEDKQ